MLKNLPLICMLGFGLWGCGDNISPKNQDRDRLPEESNKPRPIQMLGDSIFRHQDGVEKLLESKLNQTIDNHATNGHRLRDIQAQYLRLSNRTGITVVMDGVGNDILSGREACATNLTSRCRQIIDEAMDVLNQTLQQMAKDRIAAVYYSTYFRPEPQRWTPITSRYAYRGAYPEAIDYAAEKARELCNSVDLKCRFVDQRVIADERRPYTDDGIHPSWASIESITDKIAAQIQSDR